MKIDIASNKQDEKKQEPTLNDRDFFKIQVEKYKTKAKFAPFCIGFYHMSGTVGKRRAKRTCHLLNHASDEGVNFVIYILSTLSAKTLNSYLQDNNRAKYAVKTVIDKMSDVIFKENKNLKLAITVFTNFLNVINYPSEKFKEQINNIIKEFSFIKLLDDDSALVIALNQLNKEMESEVNFQELKTMHMR